MPHSPICLAWIYALHVLISYICLQINLLAFQKAHVVYSLLGIYTQFPGSGFELENGATLSVEFMRSLCVLQDQLFRTSPVS